MPSQELLDGQRFLLTPTTNMADGVPSATDTAQLLGQLVLRAREAVVPSLGQAGAMHVGEVHLFEF